MPLHAFRCESCKHGWELLMKQQDPDPSACPECGANSPRRLMGTPTQRWRPSDGQGGWTRNQYGALQRAVDSGRAKGDG